MRTIIEKLYEVIEERRDNPSEKSYVASLMAGGLPKISAKILEEANELIEAAGETDEAHFVHEAADLLFHYLVLLGRQRVSPEKVFAELARRFGMSGIAEKEARQRGETYAKRE